MIVSHIAIAAAATTAALLAVASSSAALAEETPAPIGAGVRPDGAGETPDAGQPASINPRSAPNR